VIKRSSYLEKYFDKQPGDIKFAASQLQNIQQATFVMVHGGVREVQPGHSESQIAIWSMIFF
jgi:hypothetical protein